MYIKLTKEQIEEKNIRDYIVKSDLNMYLIAESLIGSRVMKNSRKPFKSTAQIATVKDVIRNPNTYQWAVTFEEDDSCVDVKQINHRDKY